MRECGECRACCEGWLVGDAFGCAFGHGKTCTFLRDGCSVYLFRPQACKNFYCAWAQELLPESMRPDACGAMVTVERWSGGQFLRCISLGSPLGAAEKSHVLRFCEANSAPVIFEDGESSSMVGPREFLDEMVTRRARSGCSSPSGTAPAPTAAARFPLKLTGG